MHTPKLCLVTWNIFAAKNNNINSLLIKKKPTNDKIIITIGITIKPILFFLIYGEFALSSRKGHVAPKWVSAKSKMVNIINPVSKLGNWYRIKA